MTPLGKFNVKVAVALAGVIVFFLGGALFMAGTIYIGWLRDQKQNKTDSQLSVAIQTAIQAKQQVASDHYVVFAVCRRFIRDESVSMRVAQIDAATSAKIARIENMYHGDTAVNKRTSAISEQEYHDARSAIIDESAKKRAAILGTVKKMPDCHTAMAKAFVDAERTPHPKPAPST